MWILLVWLGAGTTGQWDSGTVSGVKGVRIRHRPGVTPLCLWSSLYEETEIPVDVESSEEISNTKTGVGF